MRACIEQRDYRLLACGKSTTRNDRRFEPVTIPARSLLMVLLTLDALVGAAPGNAAPLANDVIRVEVSPADEG